jgi:DNA-binding response OmpR family regulator
MKKILIVEDKLEVRELVSVTLRIGEYEILQAENGSMGVDLARRHKPDLILMDVMMPGDIDGLEATRLIKEDRETSAAKVVILTAKGQEMDRQEGARAGADGYFTKPFSPLELIKKVEEFLE